MKRIVVGSIVLMMVLAAGCQKCGDQKCDQEQPQKGGNVCGTQACSSGSIPTETTAGALSLMGSASKSLTTAEAAQAAVMLNRGLAYLLTQQNENGGWSLDKGVHEPAITGLVLRGLMRHPDFNLHTPAVEKGFKRLLSFQQPDGGIYNPKEGYQNYTVALATCALSQADDPRLKSAKDKAVAYLRGLQIVPGSQSRDAKNPGKTIPAGHPFEGGVSYGKHGRPDLNNMGWWMEAMHEAGVKADDPAMQKALQFVLRCQNNSESNKLPFAQTGSRDGGFIYAPAKRDITIPESKAGGDVDTGAYQRYGTVSYAGLKSMLYAGLDRNDPRVKAVVAYLRRNWTFDKNPGMPKARDQQSLYFYYTVLSRALQVYGVDEIPSIDGKTKHNWRAELVSALAGRQQENGSWVNSAVRWGENNPVLVTGYEVLALEDALSK